MIIIVNTNKDKIELTLEEFKKYLEEARQEGYDEGYRIGSAEGKQTYPYIIQPNWEPKKNWWDWGSTWCNGLDNVVSTSCKEETEKVHYPNSACMYH